VQDANGQEIELWSVPVPMHVESTGATFAEHTAVVEGFVTDHRAKGPDVALVRAAARIAKTDPDAAETQFTAASAAHDVAKQITLESAPGFVPTARNIGGLS
jgi:hypothetical protein